MQIATENDVTSDIDTIDYVVYMINASYKRQARPFLALVLYMGMGGSESGRVNLDSLQGTLTSNFGNH
jgi:hypothetical protein